MMNFSQALQQLKDGEKISRAGWNGKGMFLVLVPGTAQVNFTEGSAYRKTGLASADIAPHIDMFTAQGHFQPGWLASQADLLAEDWQIV